MKKIQFVSGIFCLVLSLVLNSCSSAKDVLVISEEEKKVFEVKEGEAVEIVNAEADYEITILDPGFYTWLQGFARPKGYYSKAFMANRNFLWAQEWNRRVLGPGYGDVRLYEMRINYDPGIDYGYDVNYQLYNYFIYFQRRYGQRLGTWVPRI
ncbi:MAG: DUF6146 family protein [Bacteroidota bacterium]